MKKFISLIFAIILCVSVSLAYTLKVDDGRAMITSTTRSGATVEFGIEDQEGLTWSVTEGSVTITDVNNRVGIKQFTMPQSNVAITLIRPGDTRTLTVRTSVGTEVVIEKEVGKLVEVTAEVIDGYLFKNWTVDGVTFNDLTQATLSFIMPTNDVNLTANYVLALHPITATAGTNGSISPAGSTDVKHGESQTYTITANTGYSVNDVLVDGVSVGAVTSYTFENVTIDHTISATFKANTYTVTLNNQSATTAGSTSVTATYGSVLPSITVPTKTGYTFGGYFTETGGKGTQYYTASGTSTVNWNIAATTTLYAKWTANTYTVSFNSNGGSSATAITVTYGGTYGTLPNPSKDEYTFVGWYKESGLTNQVTSSTQVTATSNHTLYAKWKSIIPTYTYTGSSYTGKDDDYWYIYFTSDGDLTLDANATIDAFLVGGGGGGGGYSGGSQGQGGGGGGYTTTTRNISITSGTSYDIVIGAGGSGGSSEYDYGRTGGTTTAFGSSAAGGSGGIYGGGSNADATYIGGCGGSGGGGTLYSDWSGGGGSDGGNGEGVRGGKGQGTTTRAFGEANGTLYAGGGGSFAAVGAAALPGGAGGGGNGRQSGTANTGGGGGANGGSGGSGIVIIRGPLNNVYTVTLDNQSPTTSGSTSVVAAYGSDMPSITLPTKNGYLFGGYYSTTNGGGTQYYDRDGKSVRTYDLKATTTLYAYWVAVPTYTYGGTSKMYMDDTYWYLELQSSASLKFNSSETVDVFLVGGGGGGGGYSGGSQGQGGGGGGYTTTTRNVSITSGTSYDIVIGAGGSGGSSEYDYGRSGETTTAFGSSAAGGSGGVYGGGSNADATYIGGCGGSGGSGTLYAQGGGSGGSDGSNGGGVRGGKGQGTTTRAFGEANGTLYAGGGGCFEAVGAVAHSGGAGGGGKGRQSGTANTGGGGGANGGSGGSGVVIIRAPLK